ncbi:hypothetical protein [Rhodococcus sp. BP-332]|uniref:hypothetical protein n=1 Tax=Rhodococcus sp. BP-332 TaxID=2739447 RepID=UPI0021BF1A37|nr:hypothetical protein [Rhodococcus sp. BP-332]
MRQTTRRAAVALALAIPVLLGVGAGTASAAPQTSILQVPVVTGLEIGPVSVPGGLIQTTPIEATVGERPGSVRFSAADIKPYYYQYNYRWMTVQWRNLSTGAAGAVDFRHWASEDLSAVDPNAGARGLPLDVVADTGPGQVAVVVTQSRQFPAPFSETLFPGLSLLTVP